MKTNRELSDEQWRLWSQIGDIGNAIRSLQSIDAELRRRAEAVGKELRQRNAGNRACLIAQVEAELRQRNADKRASLLAQQDSGEVA